MVRRKKYIYVLKSNGKSIGVRETKQKALKDKKLAGKFGRKNLSITKKKVFFTTKKGYWTK